MSISTSASTRSGCGEHEPAHDHPAHRVAEQPARVGAERVERRPECRRRTGRASSAAGSSGPSLSPWPRWSKRHDVVVARQRRRRWSAKSSFAPPNPCTRRSVGPRPLLDAPPAPTPSSVDHPHARPPSVRSPARRPRRPSPSGHDRRSTATEPDARRLGWRRTPRAARAAAPGSLMLGLRIVVSAVLLAVLVTQDRLRGRLPEAPPPRRRSSCFALRGAHGDARHRALGLALAAGARRVRRAASRCGRSPPTTSRASSSGNVLPSTIGGDVLRVSRVARRTSARPRPRSPRSRSSG